MRECVQFFFYLVAVAVRGGGDGGGGGVETATAPRYMQLWHFRISHFHSPCILR